MKRILLALTLITMFLCCKKSPSKLVAGRWDFVEAEPVYNETTVIPVDEDSVTEEVKPVEDFSHNNLLGNKFILRNDGSFDLCLRQAYLHGSWLYDNNRKQIKIINEADKDSFALKVDSLRAGFLVIYSDSLLLKKIAALSHRDTGNINLNSIASCKFYLLKSGDRYSSLKNDPYSIVYNQWRVKPNNPENEKEIEERILNHLRFLQMAFKDADEKQREQLTYNWFNTALIIASNGVALKYFDEIKEDWSKNFYDTAQARKGYWKLNGSFKHKIKFLQTDNIYEKKVDMFQQMIDNVQEH